MIRFALVLLLLASLVAAALPAGAQDATPAAGLGQPATILDPSLRPVGEVTVREIVDPFQGFDIVNGQPARGYRWVMAVVSLKAGDQGLNTSATGYFQLIDSDGFYVSQAYVTRTQESIEAYPDLNPSNIAPGVEATGAIFFQVFGAAEVESVYYSPDYTQLILAADLRDAPVTAGDVVSVSANDGTPLGELSVTGVQDPLANVNPSFAPQRGFRYVGVAITFTNTGANPYPIDPYRFSVLDQESFSYDFAGTTRTEEGEAAFPSMGYLEIAPGESISGIVAFQMINGALLKEVAFSPTGDRRIRIAEFGPNDSPTPPSVAAAPSPAMSAASDCADAQTWSVVLERQLSTAGEAFDVFVQAAAGEALDPAAVRTSADQVRALAGTLANQAAPEIAVAAQEHIAVVMRAIADQLDLIADAAAAEDNAGIQSASDEIRNLLVNELTGGAFGELIAECPVLNLD